MAYTRNPQWKDHPDTSTVITAAKLENIEQGITDAAAAADTANSGLAAKVGTTDPRLSDARTPTAHAASHGTGGTDALTPAGIGAAAATHSHAPADVTGTAVITSDPRLSDARTPTAHTHPASQISDSTATGRAVVTATDAAAARSAIGAGTPGRYVGVNAQTGTTYTPVLTDEGKLVTLNNAAAITVTLPQDSTLAFPVGGRIDFAGLGVGLATFVAGTGATVNGTPSLVQRARYGAMTAIKIAANTWLVVGDLA